MKLRNSFILALFAALLTLGAAEAAEGIKLSHDNLKVEVIDSDAKEFFVSHTMDLKGRLFVGTRSPTATLIHSYVSGKPIIQMIYRLLLVQKC